MLHNPFEVTFSEKTGRDGENVDYEDKARAPQEQKSNINVMYKTLDLDQEMTRFSPSTINIDIGDQ